MRLCSVGLSGLADSTTCSFSPFTPSQQGTWFLLGVNFWPSVGLGQGMAAAGKTMFGGIELSF